MTPSIGGRMAKVASTPGSWPFVSSSSACAISSHASPLHALPKRSAAAKTSTPLPTTWKIERPQCVPKKRRRIVAMSTSSTATTM
jgi:hypothetical protein